MSTSEKRCPQCGALLRGDGQWCLLCHADLRPPPPEPAPAPAPADALAQALLDLERTDPVAASPHEPAGPAAAPASRGKHARGAVPGAAAPAVPAGTSAGATDLDLIEDTDVMFALLRAEGRDPVLAKLGGRLSSPSARFALIVGGAVVVSGVLIGVLGLLALVFG